MEGAFAFFLESAFVGLFLWGERRFGQGLHWFSSLMVFLGTWASGYFIITTNAWMQHPVGYTTLENGNIVLDDYWAVLFNPWMFAAADGLERVRPLADRRLRLSTELVQCRLAAGYRAGHLAHDDPGSQLR